MLAPWWRVSSWKTQGSRLRALVVGGLVLELGTLYLLSLTGSRGPLLAWLTAEILLLAAERTVDAPKANRSSVPFAMGRVLLVAAFVLFGQFGSRYHFSAGDASISNRWSMLESTGDLLRLQPWTGLGWKAAGRYYSQWFEPLSLDYLYTGLLNDYAQIGVEFGLPVLLIVCSVVSAFVLSPWFGTGKIGGTRGSLARRAYASGTILALSVLTTSVQSSAFILAFGTLTALLYVGLVRRDLRGAVVRWAVPMALLGVGGLLLMHAPYSPEIALEAHGVIHMKASGGKNSSPPLTLVFVDREVLGPLYGKSLRRLLGQEPLTGELVVLPPEAAVPPIDWRRVERVIAFGASAARVPADLPLGVKEVYCVHPRMGPAFAPAGERLRVFLPEIDEAGVNAEWTALCRPEKIPLTITSGRGLSIQGLDRLMP